MFVRLFGKSVAIAGLTTLTSYYALRIRPSIALPPDLPIEKSDKVSERFSQSFAVSVVNPNHHITIDDTHSVDVSIPDPVSHEEALASLLVGFFGGWVFAPERLALRLTRKPLVNLHGEWLRSLKEHMC